MTGAFPVSFPRESLPCFPCFPSRKVALGLRLGSEPLEAEPEMGFRGPACLCACEEVCVSEDKLRGVREGRSQGVASDGTRPQPRTRTGEPWGCRLQQTLPSPEAGSLGLCTLTPRRVMERHLRLSPKNNPVRNLTA